MSVSRLLAALLLCVPLLAGAQDWPAKPIRFVSPFPPGGSVDPLARLMANKVGESL
jgi:tripartite-type tricarboxylate transporter receptor subunit TctC